MKRVMIIVPEFSIGGGAERIAGQLGHQLEKRGYRVFFLTFFHSDSSYKHSGEEMCLGESKSGSRFSFFKVFSRARAIASLVRQKKVDTCVSFLEISNFALLLSKRFGNKAKIVLSVRNNPEIYFSKSPLYARLMKRYRRTDKVVAVSKGVEDSLRENYGLDNVCTVYNMIEQEKTTGKVDAKIDFISVGRLMEQKGYEYLLRTFKYIEGKNLYILGDGPLRGSLMRLRDGLGLKERVHFVGKVDNVDEYLNSAENLIMSSLWEGFPNVLLEGLKHGCRVISTDCRFGPREMLDGDTTYKLLEYPYFGKWGYLLRVPSSEGFSVEENAKHIKRILKEKRKKVSSRVSDYAPEKIIQDWEKVL